MAKTMPNTVAEEAERLYAFAAQTRTAGALETAEEFLRRYGEELPALDLAGGFELATRIRCLQNWTPRNPESMTGSGEPNPPPKE